MSETLRDAIVVELHERAGRCMFCDRRKCGHGGNTLLPERLDTEVVLAALTKVLTPKVASPDTKGGGEGEEKP